MPRPAFPTLDSGMAVGKAIIDNQWEQSGGDYLTFVKNYVYGNDYNSMTLYLKNKKSYVITGI